MKKIFYSIMALALLTGCSNEDMMPDAPKEGLIELASVGIGTQTRGSVDDEGEFCFSDGDKVLMTVEVNENSFSNSFTYNGGKWTQDAPVGDYRSIYVQDSPTINSIVSYGGKVEGGVYTDQSSMESYVMASSLAADPMRYLGYITMIDGNVETARLDHDNSDLALKVYDGYDEKNTLAENTPVLEVTVDEDGSGPYSNTLTFTAWNAGKASDAYGYVYTLFRVQLPAGCSILEAELSNVNDVAGSLTTDIHFRTNDGQPSNEIDLEAGRRYSASYTYNMLNTVATVNVSISAFEGGDFDYDIIASKDWSFDDNTHTYTVFSAEGLQIVNKDIAENIKTKKDYNITLAADITLSDPANGDGNNWIPLGHSDSNGYAYQGTFNGAGHTISNLQVNRTDMVYPALVGYAGEGCKIENLTLTNPTIIGDNYAGGIIAFTWDKNVSITNCHITGGSIKGVTVGGVAGEYEGDIVACTVNGTILEGYTAGGIVGGQYIGRIIACGVDGVNLTATGNYLGGIAGYVSVVYDDTYTRIYSCYVNDCTKGTDSQAIEGNANLIGGIFVQDSDTAEMYNCAYRVKNGNITYGIGGTKAGPTENGYTVDMFITQTGMTSTDWSIAASNLNEGIRDWNEYNPTFPCNWEWDATEEGKLKVKQ